MRYISRISGYSHVQAKRITASYLKHGKARWRHRATRGFARRYDNKDIELSEYINRNVAKLLNKLLIELTKSRARHSNDNALAECKNGAIVRKHLGFMHIPQKWAPQINQFTADFLNPYLNYHRPCFFPEIKTDHKGRQVKTYPYRCMMTPYEKLKSLPQSKGYLKSHITFEMLDDIVYQMSDNDAAKQLNQEKTKLFKTIFGRK